MIEQILQNYLIEALSLPVVLETPEQIPQRYVLIEKTGSRVDDHIHEATFAIQSIVSNSLHLIEAAELNERVKAAMENIVRLDPVFRCVCNTDYNFTNPETKQYRYQAVFHLTYKEV